MVEDCMKAWCGRWYGRMVRKNENRRFTWRMQCVWKNGRRLYESIVWEIVWYQRLVWENERMSNVCGRRMVEDWYGSMVWELDSMGDRTQRTWKQGGWNLKQWRRGRCWRSWEMREQRSRITRRQSATYQTSISVLLPKLSSLIAATDICNLHTRRGSVHPSLPWGRRGRG